MTHIFLQLMVAIFVFLGDYFYAGFDFFKHLFGHVRDYFLLKDVVGFSVIEIIDFGGNFFFW